MAAKASKSSKASKAKMPMKGKPMMPQREMFKMMLAEKGKGKKK